MTRTFRHGFLNYVLISWIAATGIGCAKTESWVDEAVLNDGSTIDVRREVKFQFGGGDLSQALTRWPDQYSFRAINPTTGKIIEWSGEPHVNPILLDFVNGTPYLAVFSSRSIYSNPALYGCPEVPYLFFTYDEKLSDWRVVPIVSVPETLRQANLSQRYDGTYMRNGTRQTKDDIELRNGLYSQSTGGLFTSAIPRSSDSWTYSGKARFLNGRYTNDCRPSSPRPDDSVNPRRPIPRSQDMPVEILGEKAFDPIWVISEASNENSAKWSSLAWDETRSKACGAFLRPADPNNPQLDGWEAFVKDQTGKKITAFTGNRFCDPDVMWIVDYVAEKDRTVIIKVGPEGSVTYRISFANPTELSGFAGHVMPPTFKSEGGYLYFEWWNSNQSGWDRQIKRSMKVRVREPEAAI